jgi:hypothetical protein
MSPAGVMPAQDDRSPRARRGGSDVPQLAVAGLGRLPQQFEGLVGEQRSRAITMPFACSIRARLSRASWS